MITIDPLYQPSPHSVCQLCSSRNCQWDEGDITYESMLNLLYWVKDENDHFPEVIQKMGYGSNHNTAINKRRSSLSSGYRTLDQYPMAPNNAWTSLYHHHKNITPLDTSIKKQMKRILMYLLHSNPPPIPSYPSSKPQPTIRTTPHPNPRTPHRKLSRRSVITSEVPNSNFPNFGGLSAVNPEPKNIYIPNNPNTPNISNMWIALFAIRM